MWLLKLPFKLLALPVIIVLSLVYLLGRIAEGLSGFAIGVVYSVVFLGVILVIINQAWGVLIGLAIIAFLAFLFQFVSVVVLEMLKGVKGRLVSFVWS